ncbi:MAG: ABC transporter permease [Deltaproteobacteria bacterium]|nr:ABC transporter permease [Deltaproteobacteria bacterium]
MESLLQDLKFAVRQLFREKGFFITTALTLALCIGANTTIFSVVNSVLLRPLPFPEAERIVTMWNAYPGAGVVGRGSNGVPDYYDRRALTDVFEEVAAYDTRGRSVGIDGVQQRITTREVTPSFFELLGAEAAIGRTFSEEEGEWGSHDVAVLSHALWEQLYAGDPAVLGSDLRLDGRPYSVVGIMPKDFVFLDDGIRLWTALTFDPERRMAYHSNNFNLMARLKTGISLELAQDRINVLNTANMDKTPELKPLLIDAGFHTPLFFLHEDLVRDVRANLYLLWGGVAFVLLIGGVNVANLSLVRSTARAKELATRFALGASRRRVVQQLVTETLALTLVGGGLGLLIAQVGMSALDAMGVGELTRGAQIQLDATAVLFTFGLALAVGILVAVIPVVSILRVRLTSVFREEGRTGTAGRRMSVLRKGMVVVQIARALVLLVGAGLLIAGFRQLLAVDPGFDPDRVLTGTVVLTQNRYEEADDRKRFVDEALARIRRLPGVDQAGITSNIPFGIGFSDSVIFAEGHVMQPGESAISPTNVTVSPGYFETMGIGVVEGRSFDARDITEGRQVMVIDQALAARFWPEGNALGKRMWMPTGSEDFTNPENADFFDIVGIVGTIKMRGLTSQRDAVGAYYFPISQSPIRGLDFAIKSSADPSSLVGPIRGALAELDPELPFFDIRTMPERLERSLTDRRTPMLLTAGFSLAALLLAALGIYGVLAYLVQLRTREIGIRVALGSNPSEIFRLVLRDGLLVLALGLVFGLGGAMALGRVIESRLYGVSSMDPRVVGLVLAVLGVVALVACVVPARRATRIDPVRALAQE